MFTLHISFSILFHFFSRSMKLSIVRGRTQIQLNGDRNVSIFHFWNRIHIILKTLPQPFIKHMYVRLFFIPYNFGCTNLIFCATNAWEFRLDSDNNFAKKQEQTTKPQWQNKCKNPHTNICVVLAHVMIEYIQKLCARNVQIFSQHRTAYSNLISIDWSILNVWAFVSLKFMAAVIHCKIEHSV